MFLEKMNIRTSRLCREAPSPTNLSERLPHQSHQRGALTDPPGIKNKKIDEGDISLSNRGISHLLFLASLLIWLSVHTQKGLRCPECWTFHQCEGNCRSCPISLEGVIISPWNRHSVKFIWLPLTRFSHFFLYHWVLQLFFAKWG